MQAAKTDYQLGSAASERERLAYQGSVLSPATRIGRGDHRIVYVESTFAVAASAG
jgi:hypothetical protein